MVRPRVLLLNPPIHDFAAYDFWSRPLGLLTVGGVLRSCGAELELLDATDPGSPWLEPGQRPPRRRAGVGRFHRTPLSPDEVPDVMADLGRRLGRRFSRYGLAPQQLGQALGAVPRPDVVLFGCTMTYWYPGVQEAAGVVRRRWPGVPLVLGGVYATLCQEHAEQNAGVDHVSPGLWEQALSPVGKLLGLDPVVGQEALPAHDLAPVADAAALQTSIGCPFHCTYCGVAALSPRYRALSPDRIEREVKGIVNLGIRDVAIYDDAFLAQPGRAVEILDRLAPFSLRLHAASGLSCRGLTPEVASAMRRGGFASIRLGLETADPEAQQRLGAKVTTDELAAALDHLRRAGYPQDEIGVYVMVGLPGQGMAEVEHSLEQVLSLGARPHLAEYSPVPGSPLFAEACATSSYPLTEEPLYHNPTLLPCTGMTAAELGTLKTRLRGVLE